MKKTRKKFLSWILAMALAVGILNPLLPDVVQNVAQAEITAPIAVTAALAGNLQKVLGAAEDWDAASPATEMIYYDNGIFEFTGYLPAGQYEYKVALDDSWATAFPDSNIAISVPGGGRKVTFRYDSNTGLVTDSINNASEFVPAVLIGNVQITSAGAIGWNPANADSEMEYTGGGIFKFSAEVDAGTYEYKVAPDDSGTVSYPDSGSKQLQIDANKTVTFFYNANTHSVKDTVNDTFATASLAGSFQSELGESGDWNPAGKNTKMHDVDEDGIYIFQAFLPGGSYQYKVALNGVWAGAYPDVDNISLEVPAAGTTVRFLYNSNTRDAKDSINDTAGTVQRYIEFRYIRENNDYNGWNIWVWNTGKKDGQIDFTEFKDGVAIARIQIGASTSSVGFKIRKGTDWTVVDQNYDRAVTTSGQTVSKVTAKEGRGELDIVPGVTAPVNKGGDFTFFYRDEELYRKNEMYTLNLNGNGVKLKINGVEYPMSYSAQNERFEYTLPDMEEGTYEYSYLITKDGQTKEVPDPMNTVNGVSRIVHIIPQATILTAVTPSSISYNENAILAVSVELDQGKVAAVYADLRELGGKEKTVIDPEVGAVTIAVKDNVTAGIKQIPITVVDEYGISHSSSATVDVKTRVSAGDLDFDWDEARIYFMLTDRFNDGDKSNDDPNGENYQANDAGTYHGGDFQGIINKLDYLDELGINTIWITPVVDNIDYNVGANDGSSYYAYHGYWAKNFTKLDEHLGDIDSFRALIDAAHDKGIKIMVDVVLNHTGYGLKPADAGNGTNKTNYPTDEDRARFVNMLRDGGSDEVQGELAGLPDFKTEDPAVRAQIVQWQTDWLNKARTDRGDTIDYFRVDTVKHVEDGTWMAFKNAVTAIKPDHKMIGEWFGAGINNTAGKLQSGQMDSLLDFEFNEVAKNFVDGKIDEAEGYLSNRDKQLTNTGTLGQFLSSHDEDGFLAVTLNGDRGKMKAASALQITEKGQPVIYYGEELGLSGANNYPQYDNRPQMPWSEFEAGNSDMQDFYNHYKKLLNIRATHSKLFSKGTRAEVAGGSREGYSVVKRTYDNKSLFVALNTSANKAENVTFNVNVKDGSVYKDEYSGTEFTVAGGKLNISIPGRDQGGTAILTTSAPNTDIPAIPGGHIRIHYNRGGGDYDGHGLWLWDDVANASVNWPTGASSFDPEQRDSYGVYMDIPLKADAKKISFIALDKNTGNKDGGDKTFIIKSAEMNEIWVKQGTDEVLNYEPVLIPENTVRVHYVRNNKDYEGWGLWLWDDVKTTSAEIGEWPEGATPFDTGHIDRYGAYIDVPLKAAAKKLSFLVVNRNNGNQKDGNDKSFNLPGRYNQIWVGEGDNSVYISPYRELAVGLVSAEIISSNKLLLGFTMTEGLNTDELKGALQIKDRDGTVITPESVAIIGNTTVEVTTSVDLENLSLNVTYSGKTVSATSSWRLIDEKYYYNGDDLGATYSNGSALLKLWSPKATKVIANFYDKADSTKFIGGFELVKGEKGVWSISITPDDLGVGDLRGYFYQYEVTNDGVTKKVLDPYAKSMAVFRVDTAGNAGPDGDTVGKAAIVDLNGTDPAGFGRANIKGYEKREDAVIWEIHVRDFTSDTSIEKDLNSRWGTYKSFIDKLSYIKSLGVTHVQLLPVMAWYYGDEAEMGKRENSYSAKGNNYNWGYDPQNYFAPDGAYSENAADPELRIKELKELIDAVHDAGMGVILDVVYTHMAKADFLNDIVPNYYHFQDANGKFLGGFGNNLATNHKMAEKFMVDSVKYWFKEYKIDGMRFDMMGDATYEAVQKACDEAASINPDALFIGEGWRTFSGHLADPTLQGKAADQDWMDKTDTVGVFSDEIRNELKSGYGMEGEPRFITGGSRDINVIFNNIKGQPGNITEDDPGDIVNYIEAHDNLTLYDVIAQSIKKDPAIPENNLEIHRRVRLGNALILTSQGTAFVHAGQEYGRTKQWLGAGVPEQKYNELKDESGKIFGYFINDSYDSSDAINKFDWAKAANPELYPVNDATRKYTSGLIALRKSTNAFRLGSQNLVNSNVTLINSPEIKANDLVVGYKNVSTDKTGTYYVFVNADSKSRTLTLQEDLTKGNVLVDNDEAGASEVKQKSGFVLSDRSIVLEPLTTVVLQMPYKEGTTTGGGGTSSSTSGSSNSSTVPSNSSSVDEKTVKATVDSSGKAVAAISLSYIRNAVNQAFSQTGKEEPERNTEVEIRVEAGKEAKSIETVIPKAAVELLMQNKVNMLKLITPIATITFCEAALSSLYDQVQGDLKIITARLDNSSLSEQAKKAVGNRPVFDLSVYSGGKEISQFNGNVEVAASYMPQEKEDINAILFYFINRNGELEAVSSSKYDPVSKMVGFRTRHFSRYAIGYNKMTFNDVADSAWYSNAVTFAAAREITAGTGKGNFSPEKGLTRAQFLVMLMKAYRIAPEATPGNNFADAGNTYYTGYLAAARSLGITAGTGNNLYSPHKEITRQEMVTLLYRALEVIGELPGGTGGRAIETYEDAGQVSSWAGEAMKIFAEAGIIGGSGHKLNPKAKTSRAEMAQVFYNLLSK